MILFLRLPVGPVRGRGKQSVTWLLTSQYAPSRMAQKQRGDRVTGQANFTLTAQFQGWKLECLLLAGW